MLKILKAVTTTGADDTVRPSELIRIVNKYPFAEFGILLSKRQNGDIRFPTWNWLKELVSMIANTREIALSGHICGPWVRDICLGDRPSFLDDFPEFKNIFQRFQLNFRAEKYSVDYKGLRDILAEHFAGKQIIFQLDGVNDGIFREMKQYTELDICPLFDKSSGTGTLPLRWPVQETDYCGYSGGLSPENVSTELNLISKVAQGPIWIDAETRVRSLERRVFDVKKVERFLGASMPFVLSSDL